MIGIGTANLAAGLFQGFPVSTSGSRTAVAERAGAKSQLTGVTGALMIAAMLLFVPGLFRNLPQPVLASVVITASLSLADIPGTVRLWQQRRMEFVVSMVAFAGVAILGVLPGIAVAVLISILNVFRKMWMPYRVELGRVDGLPGFHDRRVHPEGQTIEGLVLFRFDAPLLFANARTFRDEIRRIAASEPRPTWIVVAAEPITDIDTTAADMLEDLDVELNARGISLVFAEMKTPVQQKVRRYELTRTIDPEHFFDTVKQAVDAFAARARPAAGGPHDRGAASDGTIDRAGAAGGRGRRARARRRRGGDRGRRPRGRSGSAPRDAVAAPVGDGHGVGRGHPHGDDAGGGHVATVVLLGLVIVVVLTAEDHGLGLVVVLALLAGSTVLVRYALRRDRKALRAQPPPGREVGPAARGVLVMNPRSGGGKAERFALAEECRRRGIEPVILEPGDDLLELAQGAIDRART